jgi:hypothetical protein
MNALGESSRPIGTCSPHQRGQRGNERNTAHIHPEHARDEGASAEAERTDGYLLICAISACSEEQHDNECTFRSSARSAFRAASSACSVISRVLCTLRWLPHVSASVHLHSKTHAWIPG